MINMEEQNKLLANVAKRLKGRVTAYAIGGTAMMFLGIKDATLDIDLVFDTEEDRKAFKEAAKEIGYKEQDSIVVYGAEKKNRPEMLKLKNERFDLFLNKVIHFIFSDDMKKRTGQTNQYGENLILKVASHNDIILMKCATDRLKDKDDARKIIEAKEINWESIINEAKNQVALGETTAIFELGEFLEHLKYKMDQPIPAEIISKIFGLVKRQAEEKIK